jgi:hypothetical protein
MRAVLRRSVGLVVVALVAAACTSGGPATKDSTTPSSWRRLSFAGLSFATPAGWPRFKGSGYGPFPGWDCGLPGISFFAPTVTLSSDTQLILPNCPPTSSVVLSPPSDGVQVDEIPSRSPAAASGLSTSCFHVHVHVHGLTACPYSRPALGILYLLVRGPGLAHSGVMFEVGVAGSGVVARTIIGSLRVA